MDILRPLLIRAITLFGVLIAVLVLLAVSVGATGFSDNILKATVNEEIRGLRTSLAQTIRNPDELEKTLDIRAKELRASYGLDRPWYVRIPGMVWRVLTLDLGDARTIRSYSGSTRIADIILERLPNTILLLTTSTMIVALIGIAAGVWLSTRVGTLVDRIVTYIAAISNAVPTWWIGILLILLFTYQLRWLPSEGMYSAPPPEGALARFLDLLWHSVLPVMTLVLVSVGPSIYSIRTLTLNIAQEDHVNVARAKGMPEPIVLWRHILRVAAPPIVTGLILGLAGSLGGSILTETIFNWQGMGRLYYDAIAGTPDEGLIVALTFMFTLIYVLARLLLEFLYLILDPRVRYEEARGRSA